MEKVPTMTGEQFGKLRKRVGMTQRAVAEVLETTVVTVSRWENGVHKIPPLAARWMRELAKAHERAASRRKKAA